MKYLIDLATQSAAVQQKKLKQLTFEGTKENRLIPQQMTMDSEAGVGLAFDNFDRFVETLSGKDTLHDTVGIAYQISTKDQCQGAEPE